MRLAGYWHTRLYAQRLIPSPVRHSPQLANVAHTRSHERGPRPCRIRPIRPMATPAGDCHWRAARYRHTRMVTCRERFAHHSRRHPCTPSRRAGATITQWAWAHSPLSHGAGGLGQLALGRGANLAHSRAGRAIGARWSATLATLAHASKRRWPAALAHSPHSHADRLAPTPQGLIQRLL